LGSRAPARPPEHPAVFGLMAVIFRPSRTALLARWFQPTHRCAAPGARSSGGAGGKVMSKATLVAQPDFVDGFVLRGMMRLIWPARVLITVLQPRRSDCTRRVCWSIPRRARQSENPAWSARPPGRCRGVAGIMAGERRVRIADNVSRRPRSSIASTGSWQSRLENAHSARRECSVPYRAQSNRPEDRLASAVWRRSQSGSGPGHGEWSNPAKDIAAFVTHRAVKGWLVSKNSSTAWRSAKAPRSQS